MSLRAGCLMWLVLACHAAAVASPRDTPLSPPEERATFRLADEKLAIELVVAEPDVESPVAVCWDADGRMYVAEMIDYPLGPTAGRVRMLADENGDGRYERVTVFADGLSFPNGVLAARGGIFVTAAPDIWFLKDTDGDGRADERRVVFTGFGTGNQQLRANGLSWGLDGWIYGANGRSDGAVRRADDAEDKAVSIRGRDFRFRPDGSRIEATSGQSQFGQASDDWGNRFLSWNTIPIRQAIFDQAFLDRNPRLSTHGVRDIAAPDDLGQVFPISPRPQTFNRERTDYYNALCGLTIFRSDALGPEYQGNALVGESLTNLVHRRLLLPRGPTFVSRRAESEREFLASSDSWFHPAYLANGPDGALYIVDFYRRWVEHPAFVAESLRADVDWRQGSGHGRIWRVVRRQDATPRPRGLRLASASTAELAARLESPIGWQRDTASRLLVERGDPRTGALLSSIVDQSRSPQARVHALAVLDQLEQLSDGTLVHAMDCGDPHVARHALRLAAPRLGDTQQVRRTALDMTRVRNPLVRFELCLSLGAIEGADKTEALVYLAEREVSDPWIPLALLGSLGSSNVDFLSQVVKQYPDWRRKSSEPQLQLLSQVAATIVDGGDDAKVEACLQLIARDTPAHVEPGDLAILAGVARALGDRGLSPAHVLAHPSGQFKSQNDLVTTQIAAARAMAVAKDEALRHRLVAVDVLALLDSGAGDVLLKLLPPDCDAALQSAAAQAVARVDLGTARAMFAAWGTMTSTTRRVLVASALRSRTATAALVSAVESGDLLPAEIDAGTRDALRAVADPALAPRIAKLFASDVAADRGEVVARYEPHAKRVGDRGRGAAVFEKHCLVCHSMATRGHHVGPDLSAIGGRAKETLLVDLLDPNRQVAAGFTAYTLLTRDGQVLSGLLVSETATSVTLRRAEGAQDFVLRSQIDELRASGKSLMPEGMEQTLSGDDMADLLEFLAQPDAALFSAAR